jgi:hypothetical protein
VNQTHSPTTLLETWLDDDGSWICQSMTIDREQSEKERTATTPFDAMSCALIWQAYHHVASIHNQFMLFSSPFLHFRKKEKKKTVMGF